jgi:cytochrome c-type biogenesis protein CcsB
MISWFARAILVVSMVSGFSLSSSASLLDLPVQDGGRIKPYDTFAREMLSLVWGKESFRGRPASEVVFSWMLIPDEWEKTEFLLIRHSGLREALNLDSKRLHYAPGELMMNDRVGLLIQELKNKRDAQEKMNPFDQAVQTLENQIAAFHAVRMGLGLRVWPTEGSNAWKNVTQIEGEVRERFHKITDGFVKMVGATNKGGSEQVAQGQLEMDKAADHFRELLLEKFPGAFNKTRIQAEVHYNTFHPFRWSWVIYLFALVLFSFAYFGSKPHWMRMGWGLTGLGFLFHTWGFILRVYILERAPVSNMFETVVWVAWGALIFAAILYRWSKAKILPVAAAMVAVLSLILCDVSSSVLDDTLTPLEPVLRDNFWLVTHVIIIVSSYAAFFLAFFIGDILLIYFLRGEEKYKEQIRSGAMAIYRCIQIGVVLLAAGTILGGIWADYSWGRFWGWDPKETWAFIALLGYLVILHNRLLGWLRDFGMAASAVVAFSLVIMAWYGVNFVLGAGLHTYGFGAGGVEYVAGFVAAHLLFVAYVTTLRQSRLKGSKT